MIEHFEGYLRTTLASIGDGVISTDAQGRVVFANPVAVKLLGASSEAEIVGKHLDDVFHIRNEFTGAVVGSPVTKALVEGVTQGLANHTVLIGLDGTEIPIDDSAAPIRGADGEVLGAVLVFRDISARRGAEATSRRLASIVESSDDAIISKDLNGIITTWNAGAQRIFGYSSEEVLGKPIAIIAAPDRVDEMPEILERIRSGERIEHYETVRKAKSGELVNISLTVSPVLDAEGRIVGASKIGRDITEQVRVRNELAEQRERLRVTLRSIGDAVIATDAAGIVTYLNPTAEELTGWPLAEALGRPLKEVFKIINQETRRSAENPAQRVLREGHVVGLANHTLLIARDGREWAIDDSAAPIRNDRGQLIGVVLVFRDVTKRRAAEKLLERQAAELRRTNEELSRFAYAVSHDLREPLRNIAIFSEILVRKYADRTEADARTAVKNIVTGVHRMDALLNDLLDYSMAGGPEQQPAGPVDMNEVVRKAKENLQTAIADAGGEITGNHLPWVIGHEAQLLQVFQNLIGNAIKYRSQAPPRVHIGARRRDSEWIFSVRDNGIGIEPKHHDTVFGVFRRLHGKEIPGTGIGLAICSKVIERHGGRIWVESQAGQGAEFLFSLPVDVHGDGPLD